ncbi:Gfo/Idh/MocA family oxidoreductase [Nonomuraea polychroma]|uniref:Gfo/Idh/MocA family oxidoreductase n=1 Tax=Nonomuraea polychroma TaxID=46176 RepID=UPI003D8D8013
MTGALRVVVCGTGFGQVYVKGVRAAAGFELAGILARGSDRSQALARRWGVPLHDRIPEDVDVACVVVRPAHVGTELALEFLRRGVHVLHEQPISGDELARCLREARRTGAAYLLNSFYVHLEPIRAFVAAARALTAKRKVLFADAACAVQVAYPMVDILGQALGRLRPWSLADPAPLPEPGAPFRSLQGTLAGVPLTLRVQNQLHHKDPDNHAHFLHRVAIGTDAGVLTLADTHGPVLWSPRLHAPRDDDGNLVLDGSAAPPLTATVPLGPPGTDSFAHLMDAVWPGGVAHALARLREAVEGSADTMRTGQYHLATCRLWEDLTRGIGPPDLVDLPEPRPLPVEELT